MAAAVELTDGDATGQRETAGPTNTGAAHADPRTAAPASAPATQLDPGFTAMLSSTNGDPDLIAAQLVTSGRAEDPRVWTEIQQTLGNATATRIRAPVRKIEKAPKPTKVEPTLPAQIDRDILGVSITAPAGVRVSALADVTQIVQTEVGKNEFAQKHFRDAKVSIVIVPAEISMTALPEFAHLQGKKTFDGRDWSAVRGMGGTATPSGKFSMAVAEESIVPVPNTISRYPATYSVAMHELAHVLEAKGMTKPQQARVKQLYAAHQQRDPGDANDTWTDKYGAANEQEYFAQSTNAFFDRNVMDKNHSGRAWLQKNDPDMYAFLVDLYDTQRGADGNAA